MDYNNNNNCYDPVIDYYNPVIDYFNSVIEYYNPVIDKGTAKNWKD